MPHVVLRASPKSIRHDFDLLEPNARSTLELVPARVEDLLPALSMAEKMIGGELAKPDIVERVLLANRDNMTLFQRDGRITGICALIMLNTLGLEELLIGAFNLLDPPEHGLARSGDQPAGIYVWAIVSPGAASEGIMHMSPRLRTPTYSNANLYTRPATRAGERIIVTTGFRPVPGSPQNLFRYVRIKNRFELNRAA